MVDHILEIAGWHLGRIDMFGRRSPKITLTTHLRDPYICTLCTLVSFFDLCQLIYLAWLKLEKAEDQSPNIQIVLIQRF